LFGLSDHLKRLSANGDPLEELGRIVDFEGFSPILDHALAYSDGKQGGRPPYDCVAMFKVLILAAQNNVAYARMEYLIRDRLSWLRFLGFDLGAPTPDASTIRLFRERLTEAKAIKVLFDAFDNRLRTNGYLAMGGQIVDATLVAAPKQRNTQEEKDAIKAGKTADEVWPDKPAKAAQKDVDARWPFDGLRSEVQQGASCRKWQATHRHRYPELWLQKPHRHMSWLRLHPQISRHTRRAP
jgi:transposase, IS5 family